MTIPEHLPEPGRPPEPAPEGSTGAPGVPSHVQRGSSTPGEPVGEPRPGEDRSLRDPHAVLQGCVEVVTFHRPESLYTVLKLAPEAGFGDPGSSALFRPARLVAVGPLPDPAEGQRLRLYGRWVQHPSHGRQFEFDASEVLAPSDEEGLVRYLASPAFPGIGDKLARKIVGTLGVHALQTIRDEPKALARVRGLKPAVRDALADAIRREFGLHRLHAFLRGAGLGPRQAAAVVRELGPEAEDLLRRDPYRLAGAVEGIGFALADRFALRLGLAADGPERARAGLLHALRASASEGHSLLPESELRAAARELLEVPVPDETLAQALAELAGERAVVVEPAPALGGAEEPVAGEPAVYLPWLAACEAGVAASVEKLLAAPARALAGAADLERIEAAEGVQLHPKQRSAVLGLLAAPLALLTGGPGVGKTTIVQWVVRLAEARGARVLLASPTGRAAKRLSEATGRDASTIHRLLGWEPGGGRFLHDAAEPLECDLLVVDEISMLDVALAHHLLKAVRPPTRLVLVGDPDQLPSVGPGNVLADLIASGRIPVHRLTEVFRQQEGSLIVENAHRVLEGLLPRLPPRGDRSGDFYFFPAEGPASIADRVVEVVTERIPRSFGLDWVEDVQVLAPMYRGECGVDALNERLRAALGSPGREVVLGGRTWRVGDRVVQTRNDYEKEVFNGDMGRVARADEGGVTVRYPEREVAYAPDSLADLQAAFAITVHRSQGSEYPGVVVPLSLSHSVLLQRNLLYTAMTRARRLLVLVGSQRALQVAIQNAEPSRRRSGLAARLRPEPLHRPLNSPKDPA